MKTRSALIASAGIQTLTYFRPVQRGSSRTGGRDAAWFRKGRALL